MGENQKYESTLEQIHNDSEGKKPVRMTDQKLSYLISMEGKDPEYDKRNNAYTALLNEYISDYRKKADAKKEYKRCFFWIVMVVFALISLAAVISTVITLWRGNVTIGDVGVVLSAFAGMISALIIIPKIIAEHLFPANEDANMIEMVKSMQENDARIRAYLQGMDAGKEEKEDNY